MEAHRNLTAGRRKWAVVCRDVVDENVKQKRCYHAFDYNTELTSTAETDNYKTYELPDENTITVGAERFQRIAEHHGDLLVGGEPGDSARPRICQTCAHQVRRRTDG